MPWLIKQLIPVANNQDYKELKMINVYKDSFGEYSNSDMLNEFKDMFNALEKIATAYDLDMKTDFFEEILLKLAEIDEKPKGCLFEIGRFVTVGENCNFYLAISAESVAAFVRNLNARFPELKAEHFTIPREVNGHPARHISMNCEAIRKHLLPLIDGCLKANPKIAMPYLRKYEYNDVLNHLNQLFAKWGIKTSATDCFEETLCYVVMRELRRQAATTGFFDQRNATTDAAQTTSTSTTSTIADHTPDITTTSSRFQPNPHNKWLTNLYITTPIGPARKIAAYLNSIIPGTAAVAEQQHTLEGKSGLHTLIIIKNRVLVHKALAEALATALKEYPLEQLNKYRVQSGWLLLETSNAVLKLCQLAADFPASTKTGCKAAEELVASIENLKVYFKNPKIEVDPFQLLVEDIQSKERILKDLIADEDNLFGGVKNILDEIETSLNDLVDPATNRIKVMQRRKLYLDYSLPDSFTIMRC